jgi:hypothetical protein
MVGGVEDVRALSFLSGIREEKGEGGERKVTLADDLQLDQDGILGDEEDERRHDPDPVEVY